MSDYRLVTTPAELDALVELCVLPEFPYVGFDTETTGLRRWHDTVVGFSISPQWGQAFYVPIAHENGPNADTDYARDALRRILSVKAIAAHGASFDCAIAARWIGWDVHQIEVAHCTLVMAQCLGERAEAGRDTAGGLKPLAAKFLGVHRPNFDDLFPPKTHAKNKNFRKVDVDIALPYGAADADDVMGLVQAFTPLLERQQVTATYALEVATRAWPEPTEPGDLADQQDAWDHRSQGNVHHEILWMEARGVAIDAAYAAARAEDCRRFAAEAEVAIIARLEARLGRQLTNPNKPADKPEPLNLNSGEQLATLLFDPPPLGLGLPVVKKTPPSKKFPNGNRSTDEDVLTRLSIHEPALAWLLEMRSALKAAGTYFDTFPTEHAQDENGELVLHPNYKIYGTETGRTSSDDPNVQNLPKEQVIGVWHDGIYKGQPMIPGVDPITVNARDMIIARDGYYLVDGDWDQVEYRVIGGMSQDPGLLDTFTRGIDLHVSTYALMNSVPIDSVSKDQRAEGKTLNYALNFGAGDKRVAGMLNVPVSDARIKTQKWKQAFPMVALWKEQTEEFAKRHRYVQTVFGRKRWLIFGGMGISDEAARKSYFAALREAVNMPVQGTAADLLKITLVRLGPWLRRYFPGVRTVLTTHDSFTFEVPVSVDADYFIAAVRPVIEWPANFLPGYPAITASFGVGRSWGALKEDKERAEDAAALARHPDVQAIDAEYAAHAQQLAQLAAAQTVDLRIGDLLTTPQAQALAELLGTMPGTNVLCVHIPNDGGSSVEIPNVAVTGNDGHLFAHIFERYTLGARGEVLAHLIGGESA